MTEKQSPYMPDEAYIMVNREIKEDIQKIVENISASNPYFNCLNERTKTTYALTIFENPDRFIAITLGRAKKSMDSGLINQAKTQLDLALTVNSKYGTDKQLSAQIVAWLGLIDEDDEQEIKLVKTMILAVLDAEEVTEG